MLLMHKNKIAGEVDVQESSITSAYVIDELEWPFGVSTRERLAKGELEKWFRSRAIPAERQNIHAILKALNCSLEEAQIRAMQVSLTDCYWLKPEDSPLAWEDVNYHDNGFSDDMFRVVIQKEELRISDFRLPDLTTDGVLAKAWAHANNIPILLKKDESPQPSNLLCANEVAASKIADRLGLDVAHYTPVFIEKTGERICACACFIENSSEEYISAMDVAKETRSFGTELYNKFCEYGLEEDLKDMLYFDHLIRNTDRHERNFGVIRNADTNEIRRMAPLFDNGTCLNCRGLDLSYKHDCKPFYDNRYEQLQMLSDADIHKRHKLSLPAIKEIIQRTYEHFEIPEEVYDRSVECVSMSYRELQNRVRTIQPEAIER